MTAGSFLQGLAGGYSTGKDIKQRKSVLDALEKSGGAQQGDSTAEAVNLSYGGEAAGGGQPAETFGAGDAGDFNARLAQSESGGRHDVVNDEGYTGKYQFGQARLDDFNNAQGASYTTAQLRENPQLQETVQNWHVADIDSYVADQGLDQYIGQEVGGVPITRDGMRAMGHLGGKGGMAKFLSTGGRYNPADSNGTSLSDYAAQHASAAPEPRRPARSVASAAGGSNETPAQAILRMFYRRA